MSVVLLTSVIEVRLSTTRFQLLAAAGVGAWPKTPLLHCLALF
jgi:hypothetical protein